MANILFQMLRHLNVFIPSKDFHSLKSERDGLKDTESVVEFL
jgi:hypothetical protein